MSFGEKLTKLRKEEGMSQEDLANSLNVSRQAVSKWESNSSYPETDKIIAICKLFNCSMDELIGLKEGKGKKNNKILDSVNKFFDLFIKGIKLFYSMTFKQKIKCLFEMLFYGIILFVFFLILNDILIEIFRNLFYLIPDELLFILIQTFKGILYLIFLIVGVCVLVKLYRIRYLDYYEEYDNKKQNLKNEEIIIEEKQEPKINIKEEKIIIRDPDNGFKPISWMKNCFIIIVKMILSCLAFGLAIAFVVLIACNIFVIYFMNSGLLILYIFLVILGIIIGIYILLEIIIKFIFDMKQSLKRLFVMFILAMLIIGISSGFFACELTTFSIIDKPEYNNLIYEEKIEIQDNLIITSLDDYNTEIIIEEREDILIEFYGSEYNISPIYTFTDDVYCRENYGNRDNAVLSKTYTYYNYYDYFNGNTFNDFLRNSLKLLEEKKIITDDLLFSVETKIYISKDNYEKLKQNLNSCVYRSYEIYDYNN